MRQPLLLVNSLFIYFLVEICDLLIASDDSHLKKYKTIYTTIQTLFIISQFVFEVSCYDEHVMMIEHLNLAQ